MNGTTISVIHVPLTHVVESRVTRSRFEIVQEGQTSYLEFLSQRRRYRLEEWGRRGADSAGYDYRTRALT